MSVTAVVGAQWGDEGKGRIVDWLAQRADVVIRYQGGDNAGHTVINEHGTFALHMVPSGIFNPQTKCIVGAGCVVNPTALLAEITSIEAAGVGLENLWLSDRAQMLMPWHRRQDELEEAARSAGGQIGTTKRGIGPAYADKAARHGVRLGDLRDLPGLRARLTELLEGKNRLLAILGGEPIDLDDTMERAAGWAEALLPRIVDTLPLVRDAVRGGQRVLLEGQLGVMRDLDWGTYPYVTSSNPVAGAASVGAGLPASAIGDVVGVVKAYCTAVGAGPFPTELTDATGERLRAVGREYGATTGRPRRCGWLDGVALRYASWLNGFTALAITKLDVLDDFERIQICVGYRLDGVELDTVPDTTLYGRVEPLWEVWDGWGRPTREARTWEDLPVAARAFLVRVAELAEVPIRYVSVGPERERLIVVDPVEVRR